MLQDLPEIMTAIAFQNLWQSAIIIAVLLSITRICPRMTHETRSWLWLSAFMLAVFMPLVIFLPAQGDTGRMQNLLYQTFSITDNGPAVINTSVNFYIWGLALWAAGTVFQLVRLCRSALHTRRIISGASALPEGLSASVACPIRCSDQIAGPLVTGFFRQIILLPVHMVNRLSPNSLNHILHHEYAHIQRHDIRIMMVQKILSALYWWNPVLHLMVRHLNQSREMACDERAVLCSNDIRNYTRSLLSSAEHILITRQSPLMVGIFHHRKNLIQRIERLKSMNIKMIRHSKKTSLFWSISLISVALVAGYVTTPRLALADQTILAGEVGKNLFPISKTSPVYPESAEEQKLEGYVIVKFDVMGDGRTANITIEESSSELFNRPSLIAARSFVYKPRTDNKVMRNVLHKISYALAETNKP